MIVIAVVVAVVIVVITFFLLLFLNSLSYILVYFIAGQKSFEVVSQTSRPALQVLMKESHFYFFISWQTIIIIPSRACLYYVCAFIFIQNVKKCVPAKRIISLDNDDGDDDDDDADGSQGRDSHTFT